MFITKPAPGVSDGRFPGVAMAGPVPRSASGVSVPPDVEGVDACGGC
jgi:hypothetical protein